MLIKDRIRKEVTTKRVFSVFKLINMFDGKLKKEDVFNYVQPSQLEVKQDEVALVVKFLINEKMIIKNIDNKLEINIDKKYINNIKTFKEYCSKNIFKDMETKSLFFEVTSEMLSKDIDFYEIKSFEEISNYLENKEVDKEFILAWRFWAEFLGFGKILNNQFLINPYMRILDRVVNNPNYMGKKYKVSDFMSIIKNECPEFSCVIKNNRVGLSLTLALRTLESIGKIKLNNIKDSIEVWYLYYSATYPSEITDINIIRES